MARLSMTGLTEKIDGIFPLKTFCLSLAALLLSLVAAVGIYHFFMAAHTPPIELTGKTMAVLDVQHQIIDEPIKTATTDEPPLLDTHASPDHATPFDPSKGTPPVPDEHATTAHEPEKVVSVAEPLPEPPMVSIPDAIPDLMENSTYGPLPGVRESDGFKSFDAYKAPFTLKPDTKGVIAVVMVDFGLSDKLTQTAIQNLPPLINFVANPYADYLQSKISKAHAKSIEIWMGLPMQGEDNSRAYNMGPNAILAGLSSKENTARLKTTLGRATGYAGVALTVQPAFTANSQDLQSIINAIGLRGLGIAQLDPHDKIIDTAATQSGTSFVNGDFWIDDVLTNEAVFQKLTEAEKLSLHNGLAVISFHPSPLAINAISKWQQTLAAKNIQLAPLTYAVKIDGPAPQSAASTTPEHTESKKETSHVHH